MKPNLTIKKIWYDDDLDELLVSTSDGFSSFQFKVYISSGALKKTISELEVFKNHIHGGIYDIEWGKFGQEYASGACRIRFHFANPNRLFVSFKGQGDFQDFANEKYQVAPECKLYFKAEPGRLDAFIQELTALENFEEEYATLDGMELFE